MNSILIPLALLGAATLTQPVAAEPLARSVSVSTAGLDLASAAGRRAFDLRVVHAAGAVCGAPSPADPRGVRRLAECRDEVRADAARPVAVAQGATRLADAR